MTWRLPRAWQQRSPAPVANWVKILALVAAALQAGAAEGLARMGRSALATGLGLASLRGRLQVCSWFSVDDACNLKSKSCARRCVSRK